MMSAGRFVALLAILVLLITHAQSAETTTPGDMNKVQTTKWFSPPLLQYLGVCYRVIIIVINSRTSIRY